MRAIMRFRYLLLTMLNCARAVASVGADYGQQPQAVMNKVEMEALFEVMGAMAGETDWRAVHPQPCIEDVWPGLVCEQGDDGLLHVTRLDFGYKPNPPCSRNASIPSALSKLSSLQALFLFGCFTSSNYTIPSHLPLLAPSLQQLSLRANTALVGSIPSELGNLKTLQVLSLSQNSLEGDIPAELGKLSNLQRLDLSYNKLNGQLPCELSKLKSLTIFDASFNSLHGRVPSCIGSLTMLQKMDLSFNLLHGSLPEELGNLTDLEFLALSDNSIQGPFPRSFTKLQSLQNLIMQNNPMNTELPNFVGTFQNLVALTLSNSGYVGAIPEEVSHLSNLTILALDRNNLTGRIPAGLANLSRIYELNLSENLLSGPIPFSPGFVERLGKNLDLNGNVGLCSDWRYPEDSREGSLRHCSELDGSNMSYGTRFALASTPFITATAFFVLCWVQLFW